MTTLQRLSYQTYISVTARTALKHATAVGANLLGAPPVSHAAEPHGLPLDDGESTGTGARSHVGIKCEGGLIMSSRRSTRAVSYVS